MNAAVFHFGFTFIQPAFVVVAYLKHFTDSGILLSFPVFLSNFALGIGPLLASFIVIKRGGRKRAFIVTSVIQRVMLVPMIVAAGVSFQSPAASVGVFLASYAGYSFSWGFSYYYWQELVSRTLDPDRRTSALGTRDAVSRIVDIAASVVTVFVLRAFAFPNNYVACFLLTLLSLLVSLMFVFPMKEIEAHTARETSRRKQFSSLLRLPREDHDFAWFVLFIILSSGTLFIGGLYTSVTLDRFGASHGGDSLAGAVKIVSGVTGIAAAALMGRVFDRHGRFWGFLPGNLAGIAAPLVAIAARDLFLLQMLVFVLRGIGATRWYLEISTTLGFAGVENNHRYIAFVGIAKLLPILVFTNAGGAIAGLVSPEVTFAVAAIFGAASTIILVAVLKPRWDRARLQPRSHA